MYNAVRKIAALAIGLPIVLLGIILVPLPGPGLLVMLAGLFILSLEFDWAKKHFDSIKDRISQVVTNARSRAEAASKKDNSND